MNSTNQWGQPIVPRTGYIVEFNALWYNALRFGAMMTEVEGNTEKSQMLSEMAVNDAEGFKTLAELAKSKLA